MSATISRPARRTAAPAPLPRIELSNQTSGTWHFGTTEYDQYPGPNNEWVEIVVCNASSLAEAEKTVREFLACLGADPARLLSSEEGGGQ